MIASNLDHHRAAFLRKCEGLSEAQLRQRPVRSSELTLLGLMRHLQGVERAWFQCTLAAAPPRFFPYRTYVTAAATSGTTSRTPHRPGSCTRTV
ncbi:mycothiol transferase [Streptomyces sasae]|uniref:mycothiol transferase n=1 Tax=Streptomyces sasae TaxID=1266772 RepID=UPI00292D6B36|nr:DUF664 domain-containing protein [Streptomyces sasae]